MKYVNLNKYNFSFKCVIVLEFVNISCHMYLSTFLAVFAYISCSICRVFLEAFATCCAEKALVMVSDGPLLSNGSLLHQFNALLAKCWSS